MCYVRVDRTTKMTPCIKPMECTNHNDIVCEMRWRSTAIVIVVNGCLIVELDSYYSIYADHHSHFPSQSTIRAKVKWPTFIDVEVGVDANKLHIDCHPFAHIHHNIITIIIINIINPPRIPLIIYEFRIVCWISLLK